MTIRTSKCLAPTRVAAQDPARNFVAYSLTPGIVVFGSNISSDPGFWVWSSLRVLEPYPRAHAHTASGHAPRDLLAQRKPTLLFLFCGLFLLRFAPRALF